MSMFAVWYNIVWCGVVWCDVVLLVHSYRDRLVTAKICYMSYVICHVSYVIWLQGPPLKIIGRLLTDINWVD